jgi:DNA-binding beta-propeller fold protein YncE
MGMNISPDGQSLYFVELGLPPVPQTLVQFSTASLQPIASVPLLQGFYDVPAVNPDGSLIYIPGSGTDGTVAVFSTNPFSETGSLGSWQNPHQAVFTVDGAHAYISILGVQPLAGFLNYVDVATGTWTDITGPKRGPRFNRPWGLAISPNGATLYVTQSNSFNSKGVQQKGVVFVDTASNTITGWISVVAPGANAPYYSSFCGMPAITPDGKYLYVPIPFIEYTDPTTGETSTYDAQTVAVINIARRKVIDQITVNYEPSQIAISPDGTRAYVLDQNNWSTVSVIDITGS